MLVLIRGNAAWHTSQQVRSWIRAHNRRAKREGGVCVPECRLPTRSPWLNPIEPRWVHGKRAIVEPTRTLSADELERCVCEYFDCACTELLHQCVL